MYVEVPFPWRAAVEIGSPYPARFYAALLRSTLRYGMPARRRGRLLARVLRDHLPERGVAAILVRRRKVARADLDAFLAGLRDAWPDVVARSRSLPSVFSESSSLLALERSAGRTIFVFGDDPAPLLIAKIAAGGKDGVAREADALRRAAPVGIAPNYLGTVGTAHLQEALPGRPLQVRAIERGDGWPPEMAAVASSLAGLAAATRDAVVPENLRDALSAAQRSPVLAASTRRRLAATQETLTALELSVLQHGDTSAQNCMFHNGRFTGLIDWEFARPAGIPGLDVLNAALSFFEHGVALRRWSEERVVRMFSELWPSGPYFQGARAATREAMSAAGVGPEIHAELLVGLFAHRLGRRMENARGYATGEEAAARMLEVVCAS